MSNNKILFYIILVLLPLTALTACTTYYKGPVSDHFDGKNFHNNGDQFDIPISKMLLRYLAIRAPKWPKYNENIEYDKPPERVYGDKLRVSFVGHTTVLIQTQGINIVTDPVWSVRASPVSWLGPKRVLPPGIKFEDLPPIDIVVISHNHYDHLDLKTIDKLWKVHKPLILVPLGNDNILSRYNNKIESIPLDWSDEHIFNKDIKIILEPMLHWSSRRGGFDLNKALWGAFVIKTVSGNIYFAGDTGYGEGKYYRKAQEKYKNFRLALLPIGTYRPRNILKNVHQDPYEAVLAHKDLNTNNSLAIHFGAFNMSFTPFDEPVQLLTSARSESKILAKKFRALQPGMVWWVD